MKKKSTANTWASATTQINVKELREEPPETQEVFVSRINYDIASQEECAPNEEPPMMSGTQATQPEASHHEITEGLVATVNQTTMTEAEEDTPLF